MLDNDTQNTRSHNNHDEERYVLNIMFSKGLGGIEKVFCDYTNLLADNHRKIINIINYDADIISWIPNRDGVEIVKIRCRSNYDYLACMKVKLLLKRLRTQYKSGPEAVFCHGNRAFSIARRAKLGVPIVAVAHNYSFRKFRAADHIITVNRDIKEKMIYSGFDPQKISVLYNAIVSQPFCRKSLQNKTEIVIGAMGRFVHRKGFDILIKAIAGLCNQDQQTSRKFRLLLAGDGQEKEILQNLARDLNCESVIEFIGWVEDTEKHAFFSKIDIMCVPSREESFGLVILEAMNHGVPLIATKTPGPLEILEDGESALLVAIEDHQAMRDSIIKLVQIPSLYRELIENAHQRLVSHFSVERSVVDLAGILHNLSD